MFGGARPSRDSQVALGQRDFPPEGRMGGSGEGSCAARVL